MQQEFKVVSNQRICLCGIIINFPDSREGRSLAASEEAFSHQAAGPIPAVIQRRQRDHRDDILTLLLTSSHSLPQPAAAELADC